MSLKLRKKFVPVIERARLNTNAQFDPSLILTLITTLITFFSQNCGKKKTATAVVNDELRKMWTQAKYEPSEKLAKQLAKAGFRTKKDQREAYMVALLAASSQDSGTIESLVKEVVSE